MELREECMLTTCEKRPSSATSNVIYLKCLTIILALLCVFPIVALTQTVGTDQNSPPPLGKLVDVGGYRVHLYCTGTGSPTVVIVGAGFSFDWGLIQPEVAKFTQVCAYDHSGTTWSDDGPKDSCSLRVSEVHTALENAGVKGPYVLVGHSLGGLVARLYAGKYPDEVGGMTFVDHAMVTFHIRTSGDATVPHPVTPPMLSKPNGMKIFGMESDPNFSKLADQDRQLHLWAMSQTRNQMALGANAEMMPECVAQADAISKEHSHPLGDKPLVDVSTDEIRTPDYIKLQTDLLSLSQNSKQIIAEKSGHFVIIDRPDVVVDAIQQVVQSVRNKAKLSRIGRSQ
jgi:pimeloyl-ACP methyl ester carboxylesterase